MEKIDGNTLTAEQRDTLEKHVTKDEVRRAIYGGAKNKAPGSDGISLEFFQDTWEEMADHWVELFQTMYTEHKIKTQ
jgi:hypothetical protein